MRQIRERVRLVFCAKTPATLASLISTSKSCLRAALIDFDNVLTSRKNISTLSRKIIISTVARCASDMHIRQYVYSSRRTFYQFGGFRSLHSGAQLNQKTTFQTRNPLRRPAYSNTEPKEGLLKAAEDPWLQSDEDESSFAKWASSVDPTSSLRFDWRKRSGSREITLSTPDNRKRYPKRKIPAIDPLRPGEPYFDAIQNYQNQYAFIPFSFSLLLGIDTPFVTVSYLCWRVKRLKVGTISLNVCRRGQ